MPLTLLSFHTNTHGYVHAHVSAKIIKCVSYDQGACTCCFLSLILSALSLERFCPLSFSLFASCHLHQTFSRCLSVLSLRVQPFTFKGTRYIEEIMKCQVRGMEQC